MGFPIIPGPNYANNLQSGLGFSNGAGPSIQTGTVDPTVTATDGIKGSIYLNSSTGKQYAKKDNGVSTQWSIITGATSAVTFSNSSGVVTFGGGGPTADTNLTLTITTTGNPVCLSLVNDGSGNSSYIGLAPSAAAQFIIYRNGSPVCPVGLNNPSSTGTLTLPPGAVNFVDTPAAGTYTYQIYVINAANNLLYGYLKLAAYELGAGGSATSGGSGITRSINNISSPTTAGTSASTDYVYNVSGTTTLTLPTAVGNTNRYTVKNVGTNTVTVNFTGGQNADGSTTISLPIANMSLDFISNNSNWTIE